MVADDTPGRFRIFSSIFAAVRKKILDFYQVGTKDLDGIVDQLRVTQGVECAILLYETASQEFKVSMRSNRVVDVSRIAAYFGGGGHVRAAGCSMTGSVHDVINNLSEHIEKQLVEAGVATEAECDEIVKYVKDAILRNFKLAIDETVSPRSRSANHSAVGR